MNAQTLLVELARRDITLKADGDRLKFAPVESVTPELLDRLKTNKLELLAWLRRDAELVEPIPAKDVPQSEQRDGNSTTKPSFCDTAIEVRLPDGRWALVKPSLAGDKQFLAWVAGLFPGSPNQVRGLIKPKQPAEFPS